MISHKNKESKSETQLGTNFSQIQDFIDKDHFNKGSLYSNQQLNAIKKLSLATRNPQKIKKLDHQPLPFSVLLTNENKAEAYALYNPYKRHPQFKHMGYLGKGTFSRVKLVQEVFTQQWFAAKIIDTNSEITELFLYYYLCCGLRSINKEIDVLQQLNLLQNVLEIDNKIYLIQKLHLGKTLARIGALNAYQIVSIIYQVMHKLHQMHQQRIVHCDLHPKNIMYDKKTDTLEIIDFGTSQLTKKGYARKMLLLGISAFIAPELHKKFPFYYYTQASDWYAIGKVVIFTLSDELASKFEKKDQLFFNNLIAKLTDNNPKNRCVDLISDLQYLATLKNALNPDLPTLETESFELSSTSKIPKALTHCPVILSTQPPTFHSK